MTAPVTDQKVSMKSTYRQLGRLKLALACSLTSLRASDSTLNEIESCLATHPIRIKIE